MQIEEFTVTFSSKNSSGKMGSTSIAPPAGIFFSALRMRRPAQS